MALTQRLAMRQSQSPAMTPQLQQAIKLLQYSQMDLITYIEHELERNPLLELDSEINAPKEDNEEEPVAAAKNDAQDLESATPDLAPVDKDRPIDDWPADTDAASWENEAPAYETGLVYPGSSGGTALLSADRPPQDIGETAAGEISLRDHLFGQINIDIPDPPDRVIAGLMVEHLDEAGYLRAEIPDLAKTLGCPAERVKHLLERLQKFDPPGIFARNLCECLTLQLKDLGRFDPAMEALLANLDRLARREHEALRQICEVDQEDFTDMLAELRALNPKPAQAFDHVVTQAIRPDVFLRRDRRGGWQIELNTDALPKPIVNRSYSAHILAQAQTKADRTFIVDQLNSANWLVKALHQRATTILKVASQIVETQAEFFDKGVEFLKPMVMREIADEVGLHESTISRVAANKYMATPRGIFELRYFFTSAISSSVGGDSLSAEAVRFKIRNLVDSETAKSILSDDKIVDLLRRDGVDIARRTVAKYRDSMRIPSSVQRRREKKPRA